MKIERVLYHELCPTGNYLNARIGVEYLLNENDDPKAALQAAKNLVTEFHKEAFPQMYRDNTPIFKGEEELPVIQTSSKKKHKSPTDLIIADMNKCAFIKGGFGLESFKKLSDSNPLLKEAYAFKYNELLENGNIEKK